jgi:hypothetical protein
LIHVVQYIKEVNVWARLRPVFGTEKGKHFPSCGILVKLLSQGRNSGIFSRLYTRLTVFPGVVAALGNVECLAEQLNGILVALLCEALILYARLREKVVIAFLAHHVSVARVHFLAAIDDFLPQAEENASFPEMPLSRVL